MTFNLKSYKQIAFLFSIQYVGHIMLISSMVEEASVE